MIVETIENKEGKIVAKLYIKPDGNLHPDSWLCPNGWPPKNFAIEE